MALYKEESATASELMWSRAGEGSVVDKHLRRLEREASLNTSPYLFLHPLTSPYTPLYPLQASATRHLQAAHDAPYIPLHPLISPYRRVPRAICKPRTTPLTTPYTPLYPLTGERHASSASRARRLPRGPQVAPAHAGRGREPEGSRETAAVGVVVVATRNGACAHSMHSLAADRARQLKRFRHQAPLYCIHACYPVLLLPCLLYS